jgi:8-oxo-dGTP pyrophosphatase MutT (NUDIX family)
MSNLLVRLPKQTPCTNCGESGHHFRTCTAPITSYGIIALRMKEPGWNQASHLAASSEVDTSAFPLQNCEVLLIQRRDSIGYVELLRAKYKLTDLPYIKNQVVGMTSNERAKFLTHSFQDLWIGLWGSNSGDSRQYKQEYEQAKTKFDTLRTGYELNGETISFETLFQKYPVEWDTPEWGFPKGRRNPSETDYQCAVREFGEETGLNPSQYRVFENIDPIRETFLGNNHIHYCHVYFLAWMSSSVPVLMKPDDEHMTREIGGIGWFSIEAALERIRPTNEEKRNLLLRVTNVLKQLSPLLVGPVIELAEQSARKEAECPNRKLVHGTPPNAWAKGQRICVSSINGFRGVGESGLISQLPTRTVWQPASRETFNFVEDAE